MTSSSLERGAELTEQELLKRVRRFRDGWEALTSRNQDLSDERLAEESRRALNGHYDWYCSEQAHAILTGVLAELLITNAR